MAVAVSMLTAIYHMLKNGAECVDLGPRHFMKDRTRTANQLIRKLDRLGFDVSEIRYPPSSAATMRASRTSAAS